MATMRIAGHVPKKLHTEVEYIRSVHTVSRWIHELFEPDGLAWASQRDAPRPPR